MAQKVEKRAMVDVVEIESSDEEEEGRRNPTTTTPSSLDAPRQQQHNATTPSPRQQQNNASDCRSFWKAGNYEIGPTLMRSADEGQLEHARVHPKFLHSNATSHKWAFGAIAELMDNAVDEIQNGATFLKVDKIDVMDGNAPALLFLDDGGGMDPDGIRKCMSLGYSSKKSNTTIGQYGNGFKTSTMRLGADAIVFSRATRGSKATQSIGLLSYTFLRKTGQDDVIVPMIDFDLSGAFVEPIVYSSHDDWSANLKTILEWSPFTTKDKLLQQFEDIGSHGTKIIIYNLWLNDEGIYELSFDDDDEDIRLRDEANRGQTKLHKKIVDLRSHLSYRIRYSLRAYASILYLRKFKNFKILLRGKPVEQFNIGDELKYSIVVPYKPHLANSLGSKEVIVATKIGFIKEAPDINVCGYNVYHKNRLIRPYWKVIGEGSSKGNGVVGVLEANFIEPAHDKQDFERSSLFIRLEARLKQMLMDYWKGHCHLVGYKPLDKAQDVEAWRAAKIQKQTANQRKEKPVILPASLPPGRSSGQFRNGSEVNLPAQHVMAADPYDQTVAEDNLVSKSAEELCDENIQLFLRCEEHRKEEAVLQHTVEELEKELAQAKLKYAQLSQHVEAKRNQKVA